MLKCYSLCQPNNVTEELGSSSAAFTNMLDLTWLTDTYSWKLVFLDTFCTRTICYCRLFWWDGRATSACSRRFAEVTRGAGIQSDHQIWGCRICYRGDCQTGFFFTHYVGLWCLLVTFAKYHSSTHVVNCLDEDNRWRSQTFLPKTR